MSVIEFYFIGKWALNFIFLEVDEWILESFEIEFYEINFVLRFLDENFLLKI